LDSRPASSGNVTGDRDLASLLLQVSAGDRSAFRSLYERTSGKLFTTIRRILASQAAAEDAVQEAYIRVWRRSGSFDPAAGSAVAWMTTIARHVAIDHLRRGSERIAGASDAIDADLVERLADPAASEPGLAGRSLAACLGKLEADRRSMVLLAYCHGWSREELARRYGRPVATIKTLLRRSLILLKECLGG
jgi:RNA polymerase sigma-70 factor (ECF subfamily)